MQDFSYLVKIIWPGRLLLGFINISNRIGEKQDVRLCGLNAHCTVSYAPRRQCLHQLIRGAADELGSNESVNLKV